MTLSSLSELLKEKVVWAIIFVIFLIVIVLVVIFFQDKPTPVWNGITPSTTTESEVKQKLGEPLKTQTQNNLILFGYKSEVSNRLNEVWLKEGIAVLIKEQVGNKNKSTYNEELSLPDKHETLFSTLFSESQELHFYPRYGYALLVNKNDGTVFEVWYFKPVSVKDFAKSFDENLLKTPPTHIN